MTVRACVVCTIVCWAMAMFNSFFADHGDRDLLWGMWGTIWLVGAEVVRRGRRTDVDV